MFIRFTNIVNNLDGLGKEYFKLEKVKKKTFVILP